MTEQLKAAQIHQDSKIDEIGRILSLSTNQMYNPILPSQVEINVEIAIASVQERLDKRIVQAEKVGLVVGSHSPSSTLTSLTPPSIPLQQERKSPETITASPAKKSPSHPVGSITKSQGDTYMSTSSGTQKRQREPTQQGTPDPIQAAGMSAALATAAAKSSATSNAAQLTLNTGTDPPSTAMIQ